VAPSALQVHQAMLGRPVSTIPMISAVTGESPHTVNTMLDEMVELGLVREVTGMKRNPIYEPTSSCNYFHAAQDKTA
jgi:Fic family protein